MDERDGQVPWPIEILRSAGKGTLCLIVALGLMVLGLSQKIGVAGSEVELAGIWARAVALGVALILAAVGLWLLGPKRRTPSTKSSDAQDQIPGVLPAPGPAFETLDESEDLTKAFADCERIDLMLRTGANVLQRYRGPLVRALRSGTRLRVLLLDPASEAARVVYGPGSDRFLNNARLLPPALGDLERRSKKNALLVRKTKYMPPFSMFIAYKRSSDSTYARSQINFTHTVVGGDRPTFRLDPGDRWFAVFQDEFREAWKAADRTSSQNLKHIVDSLEHSSFSANGMKSLFEEHMDESGEGCAFEDNPSTPVWKTSSMVVVANIAPIVKGHVLVIPRRHVSRLSELTTGEIYDLFETSREVSLRLMKGLGASGINWALQDGAVAGQTVPHLHVHLIPRQAGDLRSPGDWFHELPGGEAVARAVDDPDRGRQTPAQLESDAHELRELVESVDLG